MLTSVLEEVSWLKSPSTRVHLDTNDVRFDAFIGLITIDIKIQLISHNQCLKVK